MPCFTLVQVEVKDKAMAEKALGKMGQAASIEKTSRGTYMVTPAKQNASFRDTFLQRYGIEVATAQAKREGYNVIEREENGEQVLILRQY